MRAGVGPCMRHHASVWDWRRCGSGLQKSEGGPCAVASRDEAGRQLAPCRTIPSLANGARSLETRGCGPSPPGERRFV